MAKKTAKRATKSVAMRAKQKSVKAAKRFVKAKDRARTRGAASAMAGDAARSDLNAPGEVAIERLPMSKREIARRLHAMILRLVPSATAKVKWGNACYYAGERGFASIIETKAGVNLALPGATLADPHGLLEGTGKRVRHIKVNTSERAEHPGIAALIREAVNVGFERM